MEKEKETIRSYFQLDYGMVYAQPVLRNRGSFFGVNTEYLKVTVSGTRFKVKANKVRHQVEVEEGQVDIQLNEKYYLKYFGSHKVGENFINVLKEKKKYVQGRCASCRWLDICGGNFRVRAEAVTGNVWAPDPACYLSDDEIAQTI